MNKSYTKARTDLSAVAINPASTGPSKPFVRIGFALLVCSGLQWYATDCGAQDVFVNGRYHRSISQYLDGSNLWHSQNVDRSELLHRLRSQRECGDGKGLVRALSTLGCECDLAGEFYQAERYHSEALETAKRIYPENSPEIAATLHNLAVNLEFQGRFDDAISNYVAAGKIWELEKPIDNTKCALEQFGVARCFQGKKSFKFANATLKSAANLALDPSAIKLRVEILKELVSGLGNVHDPELAKYKRECEEAKLLLPKENWKPRLSGGPTRAAPKDIVNPKKPDPIKLPKNPEPNS